MALPDQSYVAWEGVETYFVDKDTGEPLSDGYVVFYSDVDQTTLKDVYQQVRLPGNIYQFVNIGSTVNLTAVGTFASPSDGSDIQVYGYIYDVNGDIELYHMKIYSSGDILQFTRDAQPANASAINDVSSFEASENQISNPQFVETLFYPATSNVYSVSGAATVTAFAPDWSIVTDGTGTVTVTQDDLTDQTIPSTPPFSIEIQASAGITSLKLRQQITQSPRLMGLNFVSGSMVARTFGVTEVNLQMDYVASNGYTVNLVNKNTTSSGSYTTLINDTSSELATTNTNAGSTGYVNIDITIPVTAHVAITSVQMVSVKDGNTTAVFVQESTPRQIDHLFHYWQQWLNYKPIPSLLTGWDFPLNPAQFGSSGNMGAMAAYIWDQTIAARGGALAVPYQRNTISQGLQFTTPANTDAFYILQYLGGAQSREIITTPLSCNVQGYTNGASTITARIYLCRGTAAAAMPLTIGTLASNGAFTITEAGWTVIPRGGLTTPTFPLNTVATASTTNDYGFAGWQLTDSAQINDTDKFAIVVTFAHSDTATVIVVNSISVVPGLIPTRPAPQTSDEVLRECQYYYQKSFLAGVTPASAVGTGTGESIGIQVTAATNQTPGPIIRFPVQMRATPNPVTLYNPHVAGAQITNEGFAGEYTNSGASGTTANGFLTTGNSNAGSSIGNSSGIHWTADARLAIV